MVERHLAKVNVARSNRVTRFLIISLEILGLWPQVIPSSLAIALAIVILVSQFIRKIEQK